MTNPETQTPETYSPPQVDRMWGTWGSYHAIPKAIYLLKGDYRGLSSGIYTIRLSTDYKIITPNKYQTPSTPTSKKTERFKVEGLG